MHRECVASPMRVVARLDAGAGRVQAGEQRKDLVVNNILLLPLNPFAVGCNMEHLAGHVDHTMGKNLFEFVKVSQFIKLVWFCCNS